MTKINFSTVLKDMKGKAILETDSPDSKQATLGFVATAALLSDHVAERSQQQPGGPDGTVKAKRFALALKVSGGGCVSLSVEDVAEIKRLIGYSFPPIVVGRSYEILDPGKV